MAGKWFSNRGQMVQVACAIVGVGIGIISQWNQISAKIDVLEIIKVLFYPIGVLLLFRLGQHFSAVQPAPPTVSLPAKSELKPRIEHRFLTPTVKVGSYFDINQPLGIRRVSVISIQNHNFHGEEVLAVEIAVAGHLLDLTSGLNTKTLSNKRFVIPAYPRNNKDQDCSIFEFRYESDLVDLTAISVDHINQPAQEADLRICLFSYRPPS